MHRLSLAVSGFDYQLNVKIEHLPMHAYTHITQYSTVMTAWFHKQKYEFYLVKKSKYFNRFGPYKITYNLDRYDNNTKITNIIYYKIPLPMN